MPTYTGSSFPIRDINFKINFNFNHSTITPHHISPLPSAILTLLRASVLIWHSLVYNTIYLYNNCLLSIVLNKRISINQSIKTPPTPQPHPEPITNTQPNTHSLPPPPPIQSSYQPGHPHNIPLTHNRSRCGCFAEGEYCGGFGRGGVVWGVGGEWGWSCDPWRSV